MLKILPLFVFFSSLIYGKIVSIDLANESSVSGKLLKEGAGEVFIDLGFDIIKIPRTSIIQIVDQKKNKSLEERSFKNELYIDSSGKRKLSSLRNLVDELGEAVVLIRTPIGLGSGFLIHSDGYIVTNDHVVAGERQISVTQFKGSGAKMTKQNFDNVKIVASGGNLDLALLKIEGQDEKFKFPFVTLGSSTDLKQGERVFAIGSPLGLERSVSEGIVSLRNRIISDRLHVQTTAEISPGNSGGPLFNYRGEVVGVNNMKVVAQGAEGLGFSIPVDSLKNFLINRDAYAFDPRNPNAGFRYTTPPSQSN
ncbi:MAG: trypsin-like peptidase domain-containing protein [Verrucomicrobiota bacterium]|nr:trypsin-like peptidase domain-containing protein [Verrucomicrobiota bacterium]